MGPDEETLRRLESWWLNPDNDPRLDDDAIGYGTRWYDPTIDDHFGADPDGDRKEDWNDR